MTKRTVVALLADTHTGHAFALMPRDGWTDGAGNHRAPNEYQELIHSHWVACWERCRDLRKRSRLLIIHAGDAVDGRHHGALDLVIPTVIEQERAHLELMREALDITGFRRGRGDGIYYVLGTEAHTGDSGSSEEVIVRALTKSGEPENQLYRRLVASVNGVLFDVAHKRQRPGARNWTRPNTLRAVLHSVYVDALEAGRPYPRYYVGAHWHQFLTTAHEDRDGRENMRGFLLPAWKIKDDYVYSVMPDALSNIGMVFVVVEANGSTWYEDCRIDVVQDEVIEL